jgi:hypothetical protein
MWSDIVKMEANVPGTFPVMIPGPFSIEMDQDFFDKEPTIECFFW